MTSPSVLPVDARTALPVIDAVCPYLLADDGAWRASTPAREHRCTAVSPAAVLAPDKQRRLCLVADHVGCATFLAATGHSSDNGPGVARARAVARPGSRPITRTAPLVLDHGRVSVSVPAFRGGPRLGQWLLIGLMGLAFAAILLARVPGGLGIGGDGGAGGAGAGAGSQVAGGSPAPRATASARAATPGPSEPAGVASEVPSRTLVPTENEPTAKPEATPRASTTTKATTYKVKRGDTLSTIADRYGTTWQVLAELNDIKDPGRLRVGQVLDLP